MGRLIISLLMLLKFLSINLDGVKTTRTNR